AIDEPNVEALDRHCGADAVAQYAEYVPDVALLRDIQVVKSSHMTARRHDQVERGERSGVRRSNHIIGEDPGILRVRATVRASHEDPNIHPGKWGGNCSLWEYKYCYRISSKRCCHSSTEECTALPAKFWRRSRSSGSLRVPMA